ncbi:MAG: hypothetical protein HQ402_01715 [Parcubacteria group bacterium]|nr:hypothetical protein [Parcubacteria group bacterium]
MVRRKKINKNYLIFLAIAVLLCFIYFIIPKIFVTTYSVSLGEKISGALVAGSVSNVPPKLSVLHISTPDSVKAIYMTSCVVGSKSIRDGLVKIATTTEINSIVIDIKDFSGTLSFTPTDSSLVNIPKRCYASDMKEFLTSLHEKGIYVIGRISVFQDPIFTKERPDLAVKKASDKNVVWTDYKGLSFIDVGAKEAWDRTILIAKESFDIGFDELNFDYIRFPSDGNMKDIYYPHSVGVSKSDQLEKFFSYLHDALKNSPDSLGRVPVLSADLFGMTATSEDDLNIGQVLEKALPYFDFVSPMVYPSHYPPHFRGYPDPNLEPYNVVKFSMSSAVKRAIATTTPIQTIGSELVSTTTTKSFYSKEVYSPKKLRPWLQDFKYGGNYGPAEVRAQIKGTYDAGLDSWMLWSPSNRYTLEALLK